MHRLPPDGLAGRSPRPPLFDGAGGQIGTCSVELAPGQRRQEDPPFFHKAGQSAMPTGYARVTVTRGSGIIASASVIDNVTNDPTTMPAIHADFGEARLGIEPVAPGPAPVWACQSATAWRRPAYFDILSSQRTLSFWGSMLTGWLLKQTAVGFNRGLSRATLLRCALGPHDRGRILPRRSA